MRLADGTTLLDFIGGIGVYALGHADPDLLETAVVAAAGDAVFQGHLAPGPEYLLLSRLLVKHAGPRIRHAWLSVSGAMANENSLKLIFNETGKSTLTIAGVSFDPNGLGLAPLAAGTDFIDNVLTGKVLNALNNASSTLRSQASAFGANLSIVQIRQDFAKNIINVLQTGSANLTLADSNEEAANSQALSTRQSIAVSALALANQSQQSVLKLLQ